MYELVEYTTWDGVEEVDEENFIAFDHNKSVNENLNEVLLTLV